MSRGQVYLLVSLLISVPEAFAADHANHGAAAPTDQTGAALQAVRSGAQQVADAAAPDHPCAGSSERCYSPAQLDQLAQSLAAEFPLVKSVTPVISGRKGGAEVAASDIQQLRSYFAAEQGGMEALKRGLSPEKWALVERGSPEQIVAVLKSLPPQERQALRPVIHEVSQRMKGLMQQGDVNPFHDSLSKNDFVAKRIMDHAGDRPVMSGPQWQGVEPSNPGAYNYGAQQSLEQNDPASAAEQARQALALDPKNAEAYSILSAASYELKQIPEASGAAQKALELDPNDARAGAVFKLAHETVGAGVNPGVAKTDSETAPELAGAWRSPQELDVAQAVRADGFARQAEKALSVGDYAQARSLATQALAVDPRYAYAYGLRSYADLKAGRPEAALKDAVAGLSLDPNNALAQKARAQALLRMGQYKEGLLSTLAAEQGDPASGLAHYLEAAAHTGMGERDAALDALKRAGQLDPRYATIYDAALQLPKDADMSLLFKDVLPAKGSAGAGRVPGAPLGGRLGRFSAVVAAALLGGGLLAFGFLRYFAGPMRRALTTVFTRTEERAPTHAAVLVANQYQTVRQIGAGGMGVVFEATDASLGRRVAVKKMRDELRLDPRERQRFVSEARLVASLRHPNIVEIYAIVDKGDELALVFEYVSGKTLHEIVSSRGKLPFGEAMAAFRAVSSALEHAHAHNIVHRDLKPSNIMINDEGAAKVMDFGIARAAKDAMTRFSMTNTIVGTPPYMAPEQEQGVVRKESDVYALAVCFYEMITGALPFAGGSSGGMLMSKINKAFVPPSKAAAGLPEGIDAVFDKAFEPDPDKRHRSVAELRAALDGLRVSV